MKAKALRTLCITVLLIGGALSPLLGQVTAGVTPAAGLYSDGVDLQTVSAGFESLASVDWEPGFLAEAVPGLALSGAVGYSFVSQDGIQTNGIIAGAGASYTIPLGILQFYAKPGLLGGIQYSIFSGTDAGPETPFLLLPSVEAGYRWPSGLRVGVYAAFKLLFYDAGGGSENERSFTLGPKASFSFGS